MQVQFPGSSGGPGGTGGGLIGSVVIVVATGDMIRENSSLVRVIVMRLILLSFLMPWVVSCGPVKQTAKREETVYPVKIEELYRSYRTGKPSSIWDGATVRITAEPGEYRVRGGHIHLMPVVTPDGDEIGLVICDSPSGTPKHNGSRLVIVGECRGPVRDGIRRTSMTDHYVLIANCSVSVLTE